MYLGRVIGTVVATRKYDGLEGCKLLLVIPLSHALAQTGEPHVAVDTVRAGIGDLVYLVANREAALALDPWFVPVDAAIVGIVDDIDCGQRSAARPAPPSPVFGAASPPPQAAGGRR